MEDITAEQAMDARAAAEADLARRDQREGRGASRRRLPGALDGVHSPSRPPLHFLVAMLIA